MRRLIILLVAAFACVARAEAQSAPAPTGLAAPLPDTVDAFGEALRRWSARHKVGEAVIVVRRQGRVVASAGIGGMNPQSAHPVASLSKAITAACVATLIRDGKFTFDSTVGAVGGAYFAEHGEPADPRMKAITISQLITHTAGFRGREDAGGDVATGPLIRGWARERGMADAALQLMLARVLRVPLQRPPGGTFAYGNAAYLMLGMIIERQSGRDYESYCRDAVLKPVGADARLDPANAALSAYGGWMISGADYLAFRDIYAAGNPILGAAAHAWMLDAAARPRRGSAPAWYGLGTNVRRFEDGRINMWHFGSWNLAVPDGRGGPVRQSFGAYAIRYGTGLGVFVAHRPHISEEARNDLGRAVADAARAVTTWPDR